MTRTEAAHTNGALSHGPVTQSGKAVSSRNAIKHGLTSAEVVIPGEDPNAFDILLECFRIDHGPETVRECDLSFEMTASRWRMRRLLVMEKAVIERELQRTPDQTSPASDSVTPEQAYANAWAAVAESSAMKQIHRHESRLRRNYEKARVELEALIEQRVRTDLATGTIHPCCVNMPADVLPSAQTQPPEKCIPAAKAKTHSVPAVQNEPDAASATPMALATQPSKPAKAPPNRPYTAKAA